MSTTETVTISAVDMSKTFLLFSLSGDESRPKKFAVSGKIATSTTLEFNRLAGGAAPTIRWYVAEFSAGVTVQRGSRALSATTENVTIASAATATSFPLISHHDSGVTFGDATFVQASLTSATNLRLSTTATPSSTSVVEWQVITYDTCIVQTGSVSFATGDASRTATLTSVDTTQSWLLQTQRVGDPGGNNIGVSLIRGVLTNDTTLTFDRGATGSTVDLVWYLVEFTDTTVVHRGSTSFTTAQTQQTATIPAVDSTRTIADGSGKTNFTADDNPGTGWFTLDLTSSTALSLTRGTVGSTPSTAEAAWFVIHFDPDMTAASVTEVSATTSDGAYRAGQTVSVTVTFSADVLVTGTPQLTLETGASDATVDLSSGSGSPTLTFVYTIGAGHTSSDLDVTGSGALTLNGGTIRSSSAVDATLTLPAPGGAGSLSNGKAIVIDTTAPTAGSVLDGTGAEIDSQSSTTTIAANWSGFSDAGSGIASFEWAIGTTSGGTNTQAFVGVGASTSASNSALALTLGTTYFVTVRATDGAGNNVTATSDGVKVVTAAEAEAESSSTSAATLVLTSSPSNSTSVSTDSAPSSGTPSSGTPSSGTPSFQTPGVDPLRAFPITLLVAPRQIRPGDLSARSLITLVAGGQPRHETPPQPAPEPPAQTRGPELLPARAPLAGNPAPEAPWSLLQLRNDGRVIPFGGQTTGRLITLQALGDAHGNAPWSLQVEVQFRGASFTGRPSAESRPVAPGTRASLTIRGLRPGHYIWRARSISATGAVSPWIAPGRFSGRAARQVAAFWIAKRARLGWAPLERRTAHLRRPQAPGLQFPPQKDPIGPDAPWVAYAAIGMLSLLSACGTGGIRL